MITIEAKVIIQKTPEEICHFILTLDREHYRQWHADHIDFHTRERTPDIVGSVLNFEEKIGNIHLNYDWTIEEYIENRKFLLKAKYIVPITLLLEFTPQEDHKTEVLQRITVGFEHAAGKIVDMVIEHAFIDEKQQEQLQNHFKEEFKNLEKIM